MTSSTYFRHYLPQVFNCPLMLSPIWDYCAKTKKNPPPSKRDESIFRLFQLSLSALSTVYEPAGKWIGKFALNITGGIKFNLAIRQENFSRLSFGGLEVCIATAAIGLLTMHFEKAIALQSAHALCHNVYDLWTKPDLDDFFEMVSNALYLTTFVPSSRNAGYQCTLIFLAYRAFLSGYRMLRASKEAYQNPQVRTYRIIEAGLSGVIMVSQLFRLRSEYQLVQRLKKEIQDHAVFLVPKGVPIKGMEQKSIHLINSESDPRLEESKIPLPNRALRRVDRGLYSKQKAAYLLEQTERDKTAIKAINELTATPEAGRVSVIELNPGQISRLESWLTREPLKPEITRSGDYILLTNKDGKWTEWERVSGSKNLSK
jgi:hypothetical protein